MNGGRAVALGELARACRAELRGADPSAPVRGAAPLAGAGGDEVAFFANRKYRRQLPGCHAAAILVSGNDAALPELSGKALLVCDHPYAAFAKAAAIFHPPTEYMPGVDPLARVEAGAEVDPSAHVEAFAFVGAGAKVGARAALRAGSYVGAGARVGAGSALHPGAHVGERCEVGARCILHAGAVVGADGYGFAFDPEGDGDGPMHRKIPQAGIARLEDDVELGANTCVDRATFGETVVGRGTKVDNLVQIAHNVRTGPLCLFAAQSGVAGSSELGTLVAMGGQAGVAGHLKIGDGAQLGAQCGVGQDVEPGARMLGAPASDAHAFLRAALALPRLPELLAEMRRLKARVEELEKRLAAHPG